MTIHQLERYLKRVRKTIGQTTMNGRPVLKWLRSYMTAQITEQQKMRILPYVFLGMILSMLFGHYIVGPMLR